MHPVSGGIVVVGFVSDIPFSLGEYRFNWYKTFNA